MSDPLIILVVITHSESLAAAESFIPYMERQLCEFEIIACGWERYPKFDESYRYLWHLRPQQDPTGAFQSLRNFFGKEWYYIDEHDAVWNSPAKLDPQYFGPTWAQIQIESNGNGNKLDRLQRGPIFNQQPPPGLISISRGGEVTGIYEDKEE